MRHSLWRRSLRSFCWPVAAMLAIFALRPGELPPGFLYGSDRI